MSRPANRQVLYLGEKKETFPMLQHLLSSDPRQRFAELVPTYFLLRALLLLALGSALLAAAYLHINTLAPDGRIIPSGAIFGVSLLMANLYLILVYPVRESFTFPTQGTHPELLILSAVAYGADYALISTSLSVGANPFVLTFLLWLPACSVSGLRWWQGIVLITLGSLPTWFVLSEYLPSILVVMAFLAQFIVYILFKSVVEEFHSRTVLNLTVAELNTTQRLLQDSIAQATRQQVARDLHDELGHLVTRLSSNLSLYRQQHRASDHLLLVEAGELISQLGRQIRAITTQWQQCSTINIKSTLQTLVQNIPQPQIHLHFNGVEDECPAVAGEVIFRCCQEAITNCIRHSNARRIDLEIIRSACHFQILIRDDGNQTLNQTLNQPLNHSPGSGLAGIRDRVAALGGDTSFGHGAGGFELRVLLPVIHHAG